MTVVQLCDRLGVTRNAITVQIKQLEAEGLVRRAKRPERSGVGKPAAIFEAAPGGEDAATGAYRVVLLALLSALRNTLNPTELERLLVQAGRSLAQGAPTASSRNVDERLADAISAVNALGADAEAMPHADGVLVRSYRCPVGSAARQDSCVCHAMAAFFAEATGFPAEECCLRDDRLICQYLIRLSTAPSGEKAAQAS